MLSLFPSWLHSTLALIPYYSWYSPGQRLTGTWPAFLKSGDSAKRLSEQTGKTVKLHGSVRCPPQFFNIPSCILIQYFRSNDVCCPK